MKTFFKLLSTLYITSSTLLFSCQVSDDNTPEKDYTIVTDGDFFPSDVSFYTAGFNNSKPAYWLGSKATEVASTNSQKTSIKDIFVTSTNDIYTIGAIRDKTTKKDIAVYWKNGEEIQLTDGTEQAGVEEIFIQNNDVYIAGYNGKKAVYWKNGKQNDITNGDESAHANAIHVSENNEIHIVGSYGINFNKKAIHWTINANGLTSEVLEAYVSESNETTAEANSIFVKNNDVYIGGKDWYGAVYWKNGNKIILGDLEERSYVSSIFVTDDNRVYATGNMLGSSSNAKPKYWVRGTKNKDVLLGDGSNIASAQDIIVVGNDVYIVGVENGKNAREKLAKIWKNTAENNVIISKNGSLKSVFVK